MVLVDLPDLMLLWEAMTRTSTLPALILRTYPVGEIHLGVRLLTAEHGVVQALAHGARSPRGKLRGVVGPFHSGLCYLYSDPVKNSHKITDFDVRSFRTGIREDLDRYCTAALWIESVIAGHAGGSGAAELFPLLESCLDILAEIDPRKVPRLEALFLWRFLDILGAQPEPGRCSLCETPIPDTVEASYSSASGGFVCSRCGGVRPPLLSAGARAYLSRSDSLRVEEAIEIGLAAASLSELRSLLLHITSEVVEVPLRSVAVALGLRGGTEKP